MNKSMNFGSFTELDINENIDVIGGGLASLFLGFVGLSVSPAVACLCPPAGAGLALTSGGVIVNNWPK